MTRKFPNLFSPLKVGRLTLKNRIISAPMTFPILTSDGCLTPEAIAFYELRAKGGAAVVTVSELIVKPEGRYYPVQVIINAPNAKDSLAMAARAIKRHGAIPSMELSHGGKYALKDEKHPVSYGPSDEFTDDLQTVHSLTHDMIEDIIEAYGKAAEMCMAAGFEMLLIHTGHGWLLQQFLSPATNKRTDKYGGNLTNRARLAVEVLDRVRSVVGNGFPIELRMSAEEYMAGGYNFTEAIEFAKLIQERVDLIQVSTGAHTGNFEKTHPSSFMERGVNVHYAEEMKRHINIPVSTIGALNEPDMLEDIISTGKADAVVMARALLADPYLPKKAYLGKDDEIVRCYRCYACMAERMTTGLRICSLNPVIGSEYESSFIKNTTRPKTVLVAGGGPGGMQAALTAAERGHNVILCEKSNKLGGALNGVKGAPFKDDLYRFISIKALLMRNAGVDIRLSTEVTPALAAQIRPDVLIVAVGAEPIIPPIPGIDGENVIMANDLPDDLEKVGQMVIVMGGGLVGCETALHMAMEERDVTVIEMMESLCPDANQRYRPLLMAQLEKHVKCITGMRGVQVTAKGILCADRDSHETFLEADSVICATGQRPRRDIADVLKDCAPEVIKIGDCVKASNVTQALFQGYWAGADIE
ncbi:MAG: FAD-dependent oxidoreductase [Desulfatiglans sp.]|jgi:2,4-dienoyl-CoA reductase-like NADH-dependent reductase (Old Yellow Enzyme family)/thioredoxin reductase|nr:FAD-dependent oxidoreductase [Desulfatiglans sp.]